MVTYSKTRSASDYPHKHPRGQLGGSHTLFLLSIVELLSSLRRQGLVRFARSLKVETGPQSHLALA